MPPEDCFDSSESPILCQHGEDECKADLIEGCAFNVSKPEAAVDFLVCFEGLHESSAVAAPGCARSAGVDYDQVLSCVNGDLGKAVESANAAATAQLGTSKAGTPWVIVDGEHLDDPSTLKSVVCQKLAHLPGCQML